MLVLPPPRRKPEATPRCGKRAKPATSAAAVARASSCSCARREVLRVGEWQVRGVVVTPAWLLLALTLALIYIWYGLVCWLLLGKVFCSIVV